MGITDGEAQMLAETLLDAETRIRELLKEDPPLSKRDDNGKFIEGSC